MIELTDRTTGKGQCCDVCGAALPPDAPGGFCPACELRGALGVEEPELHAVRRIGDYELIEELARGGMGIVFKARQFSLNRLVAVKMLAPGRLMTGEFLRRFQVEGEAAAKLDHPNIVPIYEFAEEDGEPYLVMKLIEGRNLAQELAAAPMGVKQAARVLAQSARAVHHAHQRGVLHRDLKPGNILIDSSGEPLITDFGLARLVDDENRLTLSAATLGTANYMAPEQAIGGAKEVTIAADIYSLGAVLYEILTGSPPFAAPTPLETMRRVVDDDATPPSTVRNGLDRDIETICLKCLEKKPADRYPSALALAEDLERWLADEPILARPSSFAARFHKAYRRNKLHFIAAGVVALTLVCGTTVSTWQAVRVNHALAGEAAQRKIAQAGEYAANIRLARQAWEQNNMGLLRELLEQTSSYTDRGFEWFYWQRQAHLELVRLHSEPEAIKSVAFSPDGRRIITGGEECAVKVWNASDGVEMFTVSNSFCFKFLAVSPDGRSIVTSGQNGGAVVSSTAGDKKPMIFGQHEDLYSAAISPDGQRLAVGGWDKIGWVWDVATGRELQLTGHGGEIRAVAFSPDGSRIVTGGDDHTARIWNAFSGKELFTLKAHEASVRAAAFSPDGQRIVTGSDDRTARVWETSTGNELFTLRGHSGRVRSVAFSPDGSRILTGSEDQTAKVWDAASGAEQMTLRGHTSFVKSAAFSPDGRRIVTGSDDCSAKVWSADINEETLTLKGHHGRINSIAFSPDGRRIVTASDDQTAKIWDANSGELMLAFNAHHDRVTSVAFSPDGQTIATGGGDKAIRIWETKTAKEVGVLLRNDLPPVSCLAFSPDGLRIVNGSGAGSFAAEVWDVPRGKKALALIGHADHVISVAYSPDGQRIATGAWDFEARVWDAKSGKELRVLRGHVYPVTAMAFSPDSRRIATASIDRTAKVWDVVTGQSLLTLAGHRARVLSVVFSPDGRRIVTGSEDQTAKIWDAGSGRELLTLTGHGDTISSVAFSPDGRQIATGSYDGTARVWRAASVQQADAWRAEETAATARIEAPGRKRAEAKEQARALRANDPGAIKQWLLLYPIPFESGENVQALQQWELPDEPHLRPRPGQRETVARTNYVWTAARQEDDVFDLNQMQGRQCDSSVAYAVTYVRSLSAQTNVVMKIIKDEIAKVYLNGIEVYPPTANPPNGDTVSGIELKAGLNVLIFKSVNQQFEWTASLRLADAAGQPLKGITVTLDPDQSK